MSFDSGIQFGVCQERESATQDNVLNRSMLRVMEPPRLLDFYPQACSACACCGDRTSSKGASPCIPWP
ncbi:hypothetical protein FQZ97_542670 [compost metagenome]